MSGPQWPAEQEGDEAVDPVRILLPPDRRSFPAVHCLSRAEA